MESQQVPYDSFSKIIEYILCLPGTSAAVERVFAQADKIWKKESANLDMCTLYSILSIKNNMEYSCPEFYKYLKTELVLLKQIAGQEKYDFKKSVSASNQHHEQEASTSAMSIEIEDSGGSEIHDFDD